VSLDFLIDFRPFGIHSSYRFALHDLPTDEPIWLKQDNLTIVLIQRSTQLLSTLKQAGPAGQPVLEWFLGAY